MWIWPYNMVDLMCMNVLPVCMYVYIHTTCMSGQKRTLVPQDLSLQVVWSYFCGC